MRVLFISNLYPNPLFPTMASYNCQQIKALSGLCGVDVISPVPWTALLRQKLDAVSRDDAGIPVHHPVYYYTPRMLRCMYGTFFYHSIRTVARRLLRKNSYDLIYSSWLYPDSWAAAKLAAAFNLPLFVKVHGSDVNLLQSGSSVARQSMDVVRQAERVICVSNALKDRLVELGAPIGKLEVLYNGVDRSVFYPMDRLAIRQELNILPDEFVVLFVGNLKKEKGLDELIAAFGSFSASNPRRRSRLVVIGSGSHGANARQMAIEKGIADKVIFWGSASLDVIAKWMNAASVLCLPSYMEGVPNVVLEAMACGTHVIATNVGGIPELDRVPGSLTLIEPQSETSLEEALAGVIINQDMTLSSGFISSWNENAIALLTLYSDSK